MSEFFVGYTKDELVDLCRAKGVTGHSKKKVHELVELLMKAGIQPEKKGKAKEPKEAKAETKAAEPKEDDTASVTSSTSNSSNTSHEYFFRAGWSDVLPHLEDASVQLVIADPAVEGDWIRECLRVLEPEGTMAICGLSAVPTCIPSAYMTSWVTVGGQKILIVAQGAMATTAKTLESFYESLVIATRPDAMVVMPFANGLLTRIVGWHKRSFVAMS